MAPALTMDLEKEILAITGQLGKIISTQERAVQDHKEMREDIRAIRGDVSELMGLGQRVLIAEGTIRTNTTAIGKLEAWRNRKLGAESVRSGLIGFCAAIIGALLEAFGRGHLR